VAIAIYTATCMSKLWLSNPNDAHTHCTLAQIF